jgi:hypothetical protein
MIVLKFLEEMNYSSSLLTQAELSRDFYLCAIKKDGADLCAIKKVARTYVSSF